MDQRFLHGNTRLHQGFGRNEQATFLHFGNDLGSTCSFQSAHILGITRPHNDGDIRRLARTTRTTRSAECTSG